MNSKEIVYATIEATVNYEPVMPVPPVAKSVTITMPIASARALVQHFGRMSGDVSESYVNMVDVNGKSVTIPVTAGFRALASDPIYYALSGKV